jgi:hypothetical protein
MVQKVLSLRGFCVWTLGFFCSLVGLSLFAQEPHHPINDLLNVSETDWPWWRGPKRDGTAFEKQNPTSLVHFQIGFRLPVAFSKASR